MNLGRPHPRHLHRRRYHPLQRLVAPLQGPIANQDWRTIGLAKRRQLRPLSSLRRLTVDQLERFARVWIDRSSPGWLGSTIGHESEVHVNRQMMKGNWYTGDIGTALQEVESYQYELDNVDRYGTSKTDQKNLEQRRRSHFDALPSDYQQRATNGDYTMKEGDEEK